MKIVKRILVLTLFAIVLYAVNYGWQAAPILTAYGAKIMCSCVFLGGRDAESVHDYELKRFPVSLGSYRLHLDDSSATGNILGLARKKAIYRKGLGCTLVNETSEAELRSQDIRITTTATNADTIPWPLGDLLPDTLPLGVDMKRLDQAVSAAFAPTGPEDLRNTRAILVVFRGMLIAERYADGFNRESRHLGWSMTKSVMNALVGILVRQGKLHIDQPAPVPFWQEDDRKAITLNHLMQASSGLAWVEDYGGPSDATTMLFKKKDAGLFAAHHPLEYSPGSVFEYSSGTTNLIAWIVRQTLGDEDYYEFPVRELFRPVGMHSMVLEVDAGGTFVGSSFSYATARDWARFGLLYLNDGVAGGERILPEGWVRYSTTPGPASGGVYGAQFWLNAGPADNPRARPMPDVPADTYSADGFAGQNVFIIPSRELVVVKLSESRGDYLDDNRFLADVIAALP
ncbi:MAG: beta-lactamase family protein [Cyclobacteriaceae bacterium]|jgi:CubicO group peptidase (beta-lactamase class C family)|nr:beta-lactamase family protein [Cyclobacteriaceae bacterium]